MVLGKVFTFNFILKNAKVDYYFPPLNSKILELSFR